MQIEYDYNKKTCIEKQKSDLGSHPEIEMHLKQLKSFVANDKFLFLNERTFNITNPRSTCDIY